MSDLALRPLDAADKADLLARFRATPVEHCFLLTQLEYNGLAGFLGIGRPVLAGALVRPGRLLVPFGDPAHGAALGVAVARAGIAVRYIVGADAVCAALWDGLRGALPEPYWVRRNTVYALGPRDLKRAGAVDGDSRLRAPGPSDLSWLLESSARMDREDRGVDPLEEDAEGLRKYLEWLVRESLLYVWDEGEGPVFKAQAASANMLTALIEGVYTVPEARRRGVAARALRAVAREVLQRAETLVLYVNEANEPAVRLYESVGFRRAGCYRSILFQRQVSPASGVRGVQ